MNDFRDSHFLYELSDFHGRTSGMGLAGTEEHRRTLFLAAAEIVHKNPAITEFVDQSKYLVDSLQDGPLQRMASIFADHRDVFAELFATEVTT